MPLGVKKMNSEQLKELGLVLVGYALNRGDPRAFVLGAVEPEDLPQDVGSLLRGIKRQEKAACSQWLESRGGCFENGKEFIQCVADAVRENTATQRIHRLMTELRGELPPGTPPLQMAEKLRATAEKLEQL